MRQETRFKFNAYLSRVAELNGIDAGDVSKKFTVEPSVTQTLMNTMQESSDFLTRINIVPVSEMKGEKIGIGVTGSIASTTDTAGGTERQPKDFSKLASNKYECDQINFDFYIRYKTLDLWARYQDFQLRVRNAIIKRQSLDFIMAGFNGVKRAETSDRSSNPMLQDVAVGWLQKYRNEAPARVMSKVTDEEGRTTSEVIRVGKGGDYASLDALVMDATNNLIEPWYQEDPDLVVIVGRQLLADKYFPIVNREQDNSEMLAADVIISQKRIGNLPAVSGVKTASVMASDSVTATVPVVMVKASTRITLDTPEVVCTNKLITGTLEVQKGGTMRGNIEHTGGELSSNGKVLHTHKHPGDSGGTTGSPL
ncbi:phage major capsid protein, P2 family [Escherichia coli]|nr:phage major capsid protein, P2 family [Escherichia coli]